MAPVCSNSQSARRDAKASISWLEEVANINPPEGMRRRISLDGEKPLFLCLRKIEIVFIFDEETGFKEEDKGRSYSYDISEE